MDIYYEKNIQNSLVLLADPVFAFVVHIYDAEAGVRRSTRLANFLGVV